MAKEIVWEIIQNMDNGAKLIFRRGQPKAQYLLLYDAITELQHYDEASLKIKLKDKIKVSQFAYIKHTLLQKLIDAKAHYLMQQDDELALLHELMCIRALRHAAHYELADKMLRKAYQVAEQNEFRPIMQLLTSESLKLNLFNRQFKTFTEIDKIIEDARPTLIGASHISTIQNLYLSAVSIRQKHWLDINAANDSNSLDEIEKLLAELQVYSTVNFSFRYFYHSTEAIILFLRGKYHLAFDVLEQVLHLFHNKQLSIQSDSEYYLDTLNLYVDMAINIQYFEQAKLAIEHDINQLLASTASLKTYAVLRFRCYLRIAHKDRDYKAVATMVADSEPQIDEWIRRTSSELNFKLLSSVMISKFVLQQYDDALYYAQVPLHNFDYNVPLEFLILIHVFIMLIVYELNDDRLFQSYYRSSMAFFAKVRSHSGYDRLIVKTLHQAFYSKSKAAQTKRLEQLRTCLIDNKDDRELSLLVRIFNYPMWLQSKMLGISYMQHMCNQP
jgi:hypothetical protein